jgi:type VI secretion system secreted protein Hcp
MAYEFYVTIEGTKQGKFKGESVRDAHKDKLAGLHIEYSVGSPRDLASGQASGKRQHKPMSFLKEWGPATPQLLQACVTNEILKSVLFEFFHTSNDGIETTHHSIKLTNATVCGVGQYTPQGAKHDSDYDTHEIELVSLTFQKIELNNVTGKTMGVDDWHV